MRLSLPKIRLENGKEPNVQGLAPACAACRDEKDSEPGILPIHPALFEYLLLGALADVYRTTVEQKNAWRPVREAHFENDVVTVMGDDAFYKCH